MTVLVAVTDSVEGDLALAQRLVLSANVPVLAVKMAEQ